MFSPMFHQLRKIGSLALVSASLATTVALQAPTSAHAQSMDDVLRWADATVAQSLGSASFRPIYGVPSYNGLTQRNLAACRLNPRYCSLRAGAAAGYFLSPTWVRSFGR